MKLAILQMADTPQIESSALMLRHAGYEVKYCGPKLLGVLKEIACDTILSVRSMISLGYDEVDPSIPAASPRDMEVCDLFCEIKCRNMPKIWNRWPRLRNRTAWWRVNGAQPEICPRGGDEVHLACPLITACLWYGVPKYRQDGVTEPVQDFSELEHEAGRSVSLEQLKEWSEQAVPGDQGMAYTFWPPYPRAGEYLQVDRSLLARYAPPYCMCHSARAWGYGPIIDDCVKLGVKIYGNNSPAGQVQHNQVLNIASSSLALVHLKSVDCPGWALYEALLAGCPVLTGRLLNSRMLAYALLEHGKTCYEFGVPASLEYGRGDMDYPACLTDIETSLTALNDPTENRRIGEAGRQRLLDLIWNPQRDGDSFLEFMERHFG